MYHPEGHHQYSLFPPLFQCGPFKLLEYADDDACLPIVTNGEPGSSPLDGLKPCNVPVGVGVWRTQRCNGQEWHTLEEMYLLNKARVPFASLQVVSTWWLNVSLLSMVTPTYFPESSNLSL